MSSCSWGSRSRALARVCADAIAFSSCFLCAAGDFVWMIRAMETSFRGDYSPTKRARIRHVRQDRLAAFIARIAGLISLAATVFVIGFGSGYLASASRHIQHLEDTELLREAGELVHTHYSGPIPDATVLQRGMIRGMLEAVGDPYTTYQTPSEGELEQDSLQGEFGGIGAFLAAADNGVFLVPFNGGPAAQAGILEGDQLLQVDTLLVHADLPLSEISAAIRGEPGTEVALRVARGPALDNYEYVVTRQVIPLPSVASYLSPTNRRIGVIQLSSFTESSAAEVKAALDELNLRSAQAVVLDLRGNPGGLLEAALEVVDLFLDEGVILIERDQADPPVIHEAQPYADEAMPMAILIDGGTASAAEVVAAALATSGRATTFGTQTFGKGSVQSIFGLSDGSTLHITTSRWFAPDGSALDQVGLTPMLEIEPGTSDGDPVMEEALRWLEAKLQPQ